MQLPQLKLAAAFAALTLAAPLHAQPALAPGEYTVFPDRPKQVIKGIGFEIQSDSIGSGNNGLPEEPIAVPHDLIPSERERLAREMLAGFRYCRLAGGLYWRGLDAEGKTMRARWPTQLEELRTLLDTAGVEGLSFEYWSPAPFWKANQSYVALPEKNSRERNRLRPFAPDFANDPVYKGDADRFFADFAEAVVTDIRTLAAAGLKTSMFGLQNEPNVNHSIYSTCEYPDSASYIRAYRAVAEAVRKHDPQILLFADTYHGFPKLIAPGMSDPAVAALVDAYVVHTVGWNSDSVPGVHQAIREKLPLRPWFQNEYEYLTGGTTPDRCLNTVEHIMNSFQLGENPTWFWIHALKPLKNAEASGYSLGFWKSLIEKPNPANAEALRRWPQGPAFTRLPDALKSLELITAKRLGDKPGIAYNFLVNQPVTVFLLAEKAEGLKLSAEWEKTELTAAWEGGEDTVYKRSFKAGKIDIPAHGGRTAERPALAHAVFVEPSNPADFKPEIGMNLPIQIRSETLALERKAASIQPGHWIYNPYNWHAVGSFVKHMPWDSVALTVAEGKFDPRARIFAFKRPDNKLTVVVANRSPGSERAFTVNTGVADSATWRGYRYTPDEAGPDTRGVAIGTATGATLQTKLAPRSWEFWTQD
jgi:hypothetical protein